MGRRGQDGAEGGMGECCCEGRAQMEIQRVAPAVLAQSSSCLSDCYRNPGSSRSKSQTNTGEARVWQSLICSLQWQLLTVRLELLPREGPHVQSPQIHPQATWLSLAPFFPA